MQLLSKIIALCFSVLSWASAANADYSIYYDWKGKGEGTGAALGIGLEPEKPTSLTVDGVRFDGILGFRVTSVLENSNFFGQLQPGDIIYAVDEFLFSTDVDFLHLIATQSGGTVVSVVFKREENFLVYSAPLLDRPGAADIAHALEQCDDYRTRPVTPACDKVIASAMAQPTQKAEALSNKGYMALRNGDYVSSEALFRQAIEFSQVHGWARNGLGNSLEKQGLLVEAAAAYSDAINVEHKPSRKAVFLKDRADLFEEMSRPKDAVEDRRTAANLLLQWAEEAAPTWDRVLAYVEAVDLYKAINDLDRFDRAKAAAIDAWYEYLSETEFSTLKADRFLELAEFYQTFLSDPIGAANARKSALAEFEEYIDDTDKTTTKARRILELAEFYETRLGDNIGAATVRGSAIALLERDVEIAKNEKDKAIAFRHLGNLHEDLDDLSRAEVALTASLELRQSGTTYQDRGRVYCIQGKIDEALTDFVNAIVDSAKLTGQGFCPSSSLYRTMMDKAGFFDDKVSCEVWQDTDRKRFARSLHFWTLEKCPGIFQ
ncbi:MAG: hypothetical protein AAFR02_00055 [Pseudomonadota bacterium]